MLLCLLAFSYQGSSLQGGERDVKVYSSTLFMHHCKVCAHQPLPLLACILRNAFGHCDITIISSFTFNSDALGHARLCHRSSGTFLQISDYACV